MIQSVLSTYFTFYLLPITDTITYRPQGRQKPLRPTLAKKGGKKAKKASETKKPKKRPDFLIQENT